MEKAEFSICFKVLENTIEKKEQCLDALLQLTKEQEFILTAEQFSMDEFSALMDKKEPYIGKITEFDSGFEAVFAKIKPVMEEYKTEFEVRIKALQQRIRAVLEKGAALRTLEEQNRGRLEYCLKEKKQEIKSFKKSSRTVSNYYKNMSGTTADQSFFMDKKK